MITLHLLSKTPQLAHFASILWDAGIWGKGQEELNLSNKV